VRACSADWASTLSHGSRTTTASCSVHCFYPLRSGGVPPPRGSQRARDRHGGVRRGRVLQAAGQCGTEGARRDKVLRRLIVPAAVVGIGETVAATPDSLRMLVSRRSAKSDTIRGQTASTLDGQVACRPHDLLVPGPTGHDPDTVSCCCQLAWRALVSASRCRKHGIGEGSVHGPMAPISAGPLAVAPGRTSLPAGPWERMRWPLGDQVRQAVPGRWSDWATSAPRPGVADWRRR
jgi:hypothetical protein